MGYLGIGIGVRGSKEKRDRVFVRWGRFEGREFLRFSKGYELGGRVGFVDELRGGLRIDRWF